MKDVRKNIAAIVGGGICVAADDGNKVHDEIRSEILKGNRVILSFLGITRMTTAFLNAAIGQLYGAFSDEQIRKHLAPVEDALPWHLTRLKLVVDRAKTFFAKPDTVRRALRGATRLDDE